MIGFDREGLIVRYPASIDDLAPAPRRRGRWRYITRHLPGLSVAVLMAMLAAVVLWPYIVINVPSGQVGVLWKRFNGFDFYCLCWVGRGTVLDPRELREEGLHILWPWDKLYLYDLRLQSSMQTYNAISSDGVNVKAQISVRYQLRHNSVAVLHKFIGPGYMTSVVGPEIGSQARQTISQYTAQQVYTSRDPIQKAIRDSAERSLQTNLDSLVQTEGLEQPDPKHYNNFLQDSIHLLDTLVLGIELPPEIVSAINRQTEQFYMIQEFKFRVEREAEESKRKQIEADGIAAFQRTVSQGISESYLRWRGIEATLALAQSSNTKIVIIGSGKDGLPIILGNVDSPLTPPPGATPPAAVIGATPPPAASPTPAAKPAPPSAPPPGAAPSGAQPQRGGSAEPGPDSTSTAAAAPVNSIEAQASSSPLEIPAIKSILSRISGAIGLPESDTNTGAKPSH
jgi:regulator of protease activity HflC (stomatin/prohibitin superfamily)